MFTSLSFGIAVLGLFLALPLLLLARKRPANVWLGYFVFQISWLALAGFYFSTEWFYRHPGSIIAFHWAVAGLGPAYYCYVRCVTGLGVSKTQALHFLPQGMLVVLSLWSLAGPLPPSLSSSIANCAACAPGPSLVVFQLGAVGYALGVLWRLRQYGKAVHAQFSSMAGRDLRWLQYNTGVLLLLLLFWGLAAARGGVWSWLLLFGQLAMLYLLGWHGLRLQSIFIHGRDTGRPAPTVAPAEEVEPLSTEKYARSGMTAPVQAMIAERLARRMTLQRDFLNPDIALTDLAAAIGTSPQLLSQYLNESLQCSFFDYLNEQRTLEVQRLLRSPEHAEATLLDVALSAGFSSKSTFNASFKKLTGMTPSAWRKSIAAHTGAQRPNSPQPT